MSGENRAVRVEAAPGGSGLFELVLDDPDRPVNVLSLAVLDELDQALDAIGREPTVRALLVRSAKDSCFVAGADLKEIARIEEPSIAIGHAARVHRLFRRLETLSFPVVAAIRGDCLGGGLELALACHARLAADVPATRLGLPEVKLGLIPGFGGTQRLPRLVGLRRALDLILKGYTVGAREAGRIGLADRVLPDVGFFDTAREEALRIAARGRVRRRPLAAADRWLAVVGPLRDLYLGIAERRVKKETRGHYPAPEAAIAALREGLRGSLEEGLEVEAGLVGTLAVSPECKSLIRVHFALEALRKDPGADLAQARPVASVGIVGAGVMGSGIAALLAGRGIGVRLRDVSLEALGRGLRAAWRTIEAAGSRRRPDRRASLDALRRILPTVEPTGFGRVDLVIEAAVEDLALKKDVLEELEERMRPEAVFATNTSALSISELQRSSRRPERVIGMHFFNPVAKMPLVEIVRGDASGEAAVATALALARTLGKVPVVVADSPGFLVNRILAPYLMEALLLVREGVDPAAVEQAMRDFGMPMGPLELLDEVGLDVALHVSRTLAAAFPDRLEPSPLLERLVAEKRLGKKSGAGFYRHGRGAPALDPGVARLLRRLGVRPQREGPGRGALQERMVLAMLNEAARALEEGVVRSPAECDLALILGTGFPAFRGGLFAFAATLGVGQVLASLERLEARHGDRFRPAPLLQALARRGVGFLEAREVLR